MLIFPCCVFVQDPLLLWAHLYLHLLTQGPGIEPHSSRSLLCSMECLCSRMGCQQWGCEAVSWVGAPGDIPNLDNVLSWTSSRTGAMICHRAGASLSIGSQKENKTPFDLSHPHSLFFSWLGKSGNHSLFGPFPFSPEGPAQVHSLSWIRFTSPAESVMLTAKWDARILQGSIVKGGDDRLEAIGHVDIFTLVFYSYYILMDGESGDFIVISFLS